MIPSITSDDTVLSPCCNIQFQFEEPSFVPIAKLVPPISKSVISNNLETVTVSYTALSFVFTRNVTLDTVEVNKDESLLIVNTLSDTLHPLIEFDNPFHVEPSVLYCQLE